MSYSQSMPNAGSPPDQARDKAFYPTAVIKCTSMPVFRSQTSRDVACLLDVDASVSSWSCMKALLTHGDQQHFADFEVSLIGGGVHLVDAPDRRPSIDRDALEQAAMRQGATYRVFDQCELGEGHRLANARDLLRYGNHRCPLGDRVRILSVLDEHGSLTVSECLTVFRETAPVAGLASLVLRGYIEMELDQGPIGPETSVRRLRS